MIEFIIVAESDADFKTASTIANRILLEQIEWLDESLLSEIFTWRGIQANTKFSCWKDIRAIEDELRSSGVHLPRIRRQNDGTLKADGAAARKILYMVNQLQKAPDCSVKAIVLIRDLDNQPERRYSLERARQEHLSMTTVIGMADSKREAWVLNGFVSLSEIEDSLLTELRRQLHFDPVLEAHRLRATTFDEPHRIRNVKVVLDRLTNGNREREYQCWQYTELDLLRQRGLSTGLTQYMNEVEERLVPIL